MVSIEHWALSIVYYICETSHLRYPFPFFHHISGLNSVFVIHSILGHSFSFSISANSPNKIHVLHLISVWYWCATTTNCLLFHIISTVFNPKFLCFFSFVFLVDNWQYWHSLVFFIRVKSLKNRTERFLNFDEYWNSFVFPFSFQTSDFSTVFEFCTI